MARFGDPQHNAHKLAGMQKALASPNTPAHLKPHIKNNLESNMKKMQPKFAPKVAKLPKPSPAAIPGMQSSDNDGDESNMQTMKRTFGKPMQAKKGKKAGPSFLMGC